MANPNKLAPKVETTVIIVTGAGNADGFSAPLFVSEFAANASFPTRVKAYSGTKKEMQALLVADGFATTDPAYLQVTAAMSQKDGPPTTIYIGRADPGDLTWAETLDAIAAEDDDSWYALCVDARDSASIQAVNAWVAPPGGDDKFALYFAQTASAQVRDAAPGNFADAISALGRNRTALLFHDPETSSGYGPAAVLSRTGPFAFGASQSLSARFDGGAVEAFAFAAAAAAVTGSNTETFDLSTVTILTVAANGLASQDVDLSSSGATVINSGIAPYALEAGDTLLVRVDGAGAVAATIDAAPAVTLGTGVEPFTITPAWQLDLQINGGGTQSFIFAGTEVTALDVASRIMLTAIGLVAADDGAGSLEITTDKKGTGASIEIEVTSTAALLTELGLVVGTDSGTGDVVDIGAVTVAELITVLDADVVTQTASNDGGFLRLTSDLIGTSSRIQVTGGTANAVIQFTTAETSGSGAFANAAVASAAEVVSAINASVGGLLASVVATAVVLTSNVLGTSSAVTVTAGVAAAVLGLAAGTVNGSGDFADASAATAAEVAVVIAATIASGAVSAPGSKIKLASVTSGASSTVEIITDTLGLTWSGDGFAVGTGVLEDYADCAAVGRCITFQLDAPNGAALWDNQELVGIAADALTVAQKTSLDQRRVNAYYANAKRPELHWGTMLRRIDVDDILYIDEVTTADWLDARMTEDLNKLLNNYAASKTKIPYTDAGFALIEVVFRARLQISERNGHTVYDGTRLDLTSDTDTGVYIPRLSDQSQADINARKFAGLRARQTYQGGTQRIGNLLELQRPAVQL